MSRSIIHLLPEHVANQIAAGEVVNRPASAVKELLENALDSGASQITLHIEEAGKTLIRVIDNGCGMSVEDSEKCFLRHATSKIQATQDLYSLKTMGFRGEALSSIAAVAQVELKTRRKTEEVGTRVYVEGETIKETKSCACAVGTQISVKNIYFNTPARRQFLKTDEVEYKYIEDEFIRVAMARSDLEFTLSKDGKSVYKLECGTLRQRIVQLMGKAFEQRLVHIKEGAGRIQIEGFICTPSYTNKNRSKQYLFVNGRYIKHIGLTHAVETAYKQLVPDKSYPAFFLFLKVDPSTIDVNIHPTKTEIRFEDEKLIYGVLLSVIKHAIGLNQMAPALDFENENNQVVLPFVSAGTFPEQPKVTTDPNYNPFDLPYSSGVEPKGTVPNKGGTTFSSNASPYHSQSKPVSMSSYMEQIQSLYTQAVVLPSQVGMEMAEVEPSSSTISEKVLQVGLRYLVSTLKTGLLIIDQQAASERINYDRYLQSRKSGGEAAQRTLFPQMVELSVSEAETLKEIKDELIYLGWEIEWIGGSSFMVNATPSQVLEEQVPRMIEGLVENYMGNMLHLRGGRTENVTGAMARQMSIKEGVKMEQEEMMSLINHLFASSTPGLSPSGRKTFWIMPLSEMQQGFKNK